MVKLECQAFDLQFLEQRVLLVRQPEELCIATLKLCSSTATLICAEGTPCFHSNFITSRKPAVCSSCWALAHASLQLEWMDAHSSAYAQLKPVNKAASTVTAAADH